MPLLLLIPVACILATLCVASTLMAWLIIGGLLAAARGECEPAPLEGPDP